jgi:thiol:disulfide interchange protein DsbD
VKWIDDLDEALQRAKEEDKLVYIDFYTNWCRYCITMDEETYTDPRIVNLLTEEFIPVKFNREHPENVDIVKQYKIYGQPVEVVVDSDGTLLWSHRGYMDASELYLYLMSILSQKQVYFV